MSVWHSFSYLGYIKFSAVVVPKRVVLVKLLSILNHLHKKTFILCSIISTVVIGTLSSNKATKHDGKYKL